MKLIVAGAIVAVCLGWYHQKTTAAISCDGLECLFFLSYGYLSITEIVYLTPLLIWILPQIVFLYLVGNDLQMELQRTTVYVFTRTKKRVHWFMGRSIRLFFYVISYYGLQFFVLYGLAVIQGHDSNQGIGTVHLIFSLFLLTVLYNGMISQMIHTLLLYTNLVIAFTAVFTVQMVTLFTCVLLHEIESGLSAMKWLPASQGVFAWHSQVPSTIREMLYDPFFLPDFTILFSVIYLGTTTIGLVVWGISRIKQMDIF
jgi:hypothetical protein